MLTPERRARLIEAVAVQLVVPELLARFGPPRVGSWRRDAAALAGRLHDLPLADAIGSLAALNPGGQMFRPLCRDVILPAARGLRRRSERGELDRTGRVAGVWHLRMCLHSLDDSQSHDAPGGVHSALALQGGPAAPSVEHAVALRFFDRSGWAVRDCRGRQAEEACDSAHDQDFDVAWISLEPGQDADSVRDVAQSLRRASRNARILVLGGGVMGLPAEDPRALDLDGFTGSAIEAAVIAEAALRRHRPRPFLG
jgi:methylmalonyl-CoA mutase cobalamin-binding subunit